MNDRVLFRRLWRIRRGLRWMTVGVLFLFPAPAPARSVRAIGEIEATVGGIEEDVARIEARYLTLREGYQSSLRKREKDLLYKRFLEGKTLLLEEKDYEAAREFFYSLVEEEPFFQQFAEYREALFYLAESLFLTHRFDEAERYYLRVSQEGPASPFYLQVLRRLMEIALVRSDWKTFDARYQEFLASGPTPAQIADYGYLVGKRYFFEGKIERAWRFFESVPKDAPDYGYARY
ncbi:MAG: tetratricopeptide repeat protein, partial [Deltaproteobacteria bacterium]